MTDAPNPKRDYPADWATWSAVRRKAEVERAESIHRAAKKRDRITEKAYAQIRATEDEYQQSRRAASLKYGEYEG